MSVKLKYAVLLIAATLLFSVGSHYAAAALTGFSLAYFSKGLRRPRLSTDAEQAQSQSEDSDRENQGR